MKVSELLAIKASHTGNREKAMLIAQGQKATARRNNPTDTESPSGWNASPYPGAQTDHTR